MESRAPGRAGRVLRRVVPVAIAAILMVGIWMMPNLTPLDELPQVGEDQHRALVVAEPSVSETGQEVLQLELLEGERAGERIEAVVQRGGGLRLPGSDPRPFSAGEEVVVTIFGGPAGGFASVSEPWRLPTLALLAGIFAAAVLVVGGWRGLRSLIALGLTLAVVIKIVIPLILRGWDPVMLAVVAAAVLTLVTLLLTEGTGRATWAAILGTFGALSVTALLAVTFNVLADFSALQGSEDVAFLIPLLGERLNLQGLFLAATIFGALGVLDDVTMTQAATVAQLHEADPTSGRRRVVTRAMRVGRSHIAATVNTLVLAYLGAGLPLLLLFAVGGQPPLMVANGELIAVEIIRALVGSLGIVAAVPLTTFVAAAMVVPRYTR
jgi:uncharacterized membrane protein